MLLRDRLRVAGLHRWRAWRRLCLIWLDLPEAHALDLGDRRRQNAAHARVVDVDRRCGIHAKLTRNRCARRP